MPVLRHWSHSFGGGAFVFKRLFRLGVVTHPVFRSDQLRQRESMNKGDGSDLTAWSTISECRKVAPQWASSSRIASSKYWEIAKPGSAVGLARILL